MSDLHKMAAAMAWHELPSELDAVISLLGQARSQRDANADLIATLRADLAKAVEGLEGALGGLGCRSDCEWLHPDGSKCDCGNRERKLIAQSLIKELRP